MKLRDFGELLLLAAIWGGSFLFLRLGSGEFGAAPLAFFRVTVATLVLLPLLLRGNRMAVAREHWKTICLVALTNSALPFLFFSYATMSVTGGLASIFNASTPLWGALIAWVWLRDRLTSARALGLAVGFAGVLWLAADKASFKPGGSGWAVLACLAASFCYGIAANASKRYLQGVDPMVSAAGSQLAAAIMLAPAGIAYWPETVPSARAWISALLLGALCTGVAYVIYFRLIERIGAANAMTVTFLTPGFAVLWGFLVLNEQLTMSMIFACAVVLLGTSLATGLVSLPSRGRAGVGASGAPAAHDP